MDDKAIAKALALGDLLDAELNLPTKGAIVPLVAHARRQAIEAVRALIALDFMKVDAWRKAVDHQNDIRRFVDLVMWVRDSMEAAEAAFETLPREEREAFVTLITGPQTEEEPSDL